MPLQFHRAVEDMEIWIATNEGYSFVISYESPTGPGFHGRTGYMASWNRFMKAVERSESRLAFQNFRRGQSRLSAMLKHLTSD